MKKKYTVLLALPDYKASDQSCAADRICRMTAKGVDVPDAIINAIGMLPHRLGVEFDDIWDYEPVAVYEGYLGDVYRPDEHGRLITPLPEWASGRAYGNWCPNAQLQTRDGRRTGNAVLIYWIDSVATVVTDAGNVMRLSPSELESLFYPPEYIMAEVLPAHRAAL